MITTKPRIWQKICTSHLPNVKFIFIPALEMVVHDESESCGVAHFQVGPPPLPRPIGLPKFVLKFLGIRMRPVQILVNIIFISNL